MIEEVTQHQLLASTYVCTCTHMHMYVYMHHTHNESNKKQMFHPPRAFFMAHISSCFVTLETLSGEHQLAITRKETAGRQGSPLPSSEQGQLPARLGRTMGLLGPCTIPYTPGWWFLGHSGFQGTSSQWRGEAGGCHWSLETSY